MHKPRKRFGQHFLRDQTIIQRIIAAIAPKARDHLVEIGPGQGALTFPILKMAGQLDVIEIDRDLVASLQARPHQGILNVHSHDALTFDFNQLEVPKPLRIFGNLPYNISTPLIFHLLDYSSIIAEMIFMLQKEVVDRMAAGAGSDDYGRLSVMVQYHCQIAVLFDVPPQSFDPPPKVNSSVLRLMPYAVLPYPAKSYQHFFIVVKQAFSQRRKTLRNSLKGMLNEVDWDAVQIDSSLRPEQLTVEAFVKLSDRMYGNICNR